MFFQKKGLNKLSPQEDKRLTFQAIFVKCQSLFPRNIKALTFDANCLFMRKYALTFHVNCLIDNLHEMSKSVFWEK